MLYLSQPIGGGVGAGGPKFGLRIEQVRMTGNTGAPDAGNPMQHRTLIGWQFGGSRVSDMHLELGGRVTYDLRHGGFALESSSRFPRPPSSRASGASNIAPRGAKPFDVHVADEHGLSERPPLTDGDTRNSTALLHEIAAAAVVHLHPGPAQQRERPSHRRQSD